MSDHMIPEPVGELTPDPADAITKQEPPRGDDHPVIRGSSGPAAELPIRSEWPPEADLTEEQERMRQHGLRILARMIARDRITRQERMDTRSGEGEGSSTDDKCGHASATARRSPEREAA